MTVGSAADFQSTFDVSRETLERLDVYEKLLRKWTAKINLVSKSTLDDVWQRHFVDSAQVFKALPPGPLRMSDYGSGGGFPGIVVAILNKDLQPASHVTLIESDLRKATFLSTVVRQLDLRATVLAERVEGVEPLESNVVTARAFASLNALLPLADRHLGPEGTCLFLKGERHQEEVDIARVKWDFDLDIHDSLTHRGAAVLHMTNLRLRR